MIHLAMIGKLILIWGVINMNQLTKLIEQCCEEKGLPSFMVKGLIKEVENEKGTWLNTLLEWLASRPTCTANERKFLDKIQEKGKWETYKTGTGIKINRETKIMQKDFLPINLFELCKGASQ